MTLSTKGLIAIEPVYAPKVEIDPGKGFARAKSRTTVVISRLVFSYVYEGRLFEAGKSAVMLDGEAIMQAWAKKERETNELDPKPFVMCPESAVLAFVEL